MAAKNPQARLIRKWREADPEADRKHRESKRELRRNAARKARAANPEANRAAQRKWYKANPGATQASHLKSKYGISPATKAQMIADQGGACACCRRSPASQIDHDHALEKIHKIVLIRGILCQRCNTVIGRFGDTLESVLDGPDGQPWLPWAIPYLRFARERAQLKIALANSAPAYHVGSSA